MRKHFVPPPISTPPGQTYNYYTSFLSLVVTTGPPSFPPYFHPFTSLDVIHELALIHVSRLSCTWYLVVLASQEALVVEYHLLVDDNNGTPHQPKINWPPKRIELQAIENWASSKRCVKPKWVSCGPHMTCVHLVSSTLTYSLLFIILKFVLTCTHRAQAKELGFRLIPKSSLLILQSLNHKQWDHYITSNSWQSPQGGFPCRLLVQWILVNSGLEVFSC